VRVVLEQALDLPRRQDALQALGEGVGWYVDKSLDGKIGEAPRPGYDAHAQRLVEAAQASMAVLIEVLDGLGDPAAPPPGPPLASQLSAWARNHSLEADPATALRAVLAWSRLHGFVSLEIAGNCASMNIDPDPVFEIQLATLTA
jgi:hypothetical protein